MKNHLSNSKVLEFKDIFFSYKDEKDLLKNVNFHISRGGEIVCLLGASGSGKSTIIKLILKYLFPDRGLINLSDSHIPVFQDFNQMILPWFKGLKNLTYGISEYDNKNLEDISSILNIGSLLNAYPFKMSGGERQRIIFARALLRNPQLLIVDEPLSSIDAGLSNRMMPEIRRYLKDNKISSLWVTHDIIESIKLSDRILILNREGGITELIKEDFQTEKELGLIIQETLL